MQIRTRLTLQFILLVALIILFCFSVIYLMLYQNRKSEFYNKIELKAKATAELYFGSNKIDSSALRLFDNTIRYPQSLESLPIYDGESKKVYTNNDTIDYQLTQNIFDEIRRKGRVEYEIGPYRVLGLALPEKYRNAIVVAGNIDWESIRKNEFLFKLLFSLYMVSIIIVSITGRFFARRALSPLSNVIAQVNDLPIASLEARLKITNARDEIGQLAKTFNMLLDKIQNSFNLQKIFLSAASHEMKNPLTAITSQLQVLQLKQRAPEEYQQTIDSVLEDLVQLNKTTNDLIEFSRLSYEMNVGVTFEDVRIDDVLWHCKEYYGKLNPSGRFGVKFINLPEDQNDLVISANAALLHIAFVNIIDNACKFSRDNTVMIELVVHENTIELSFSDNGKGMTEVEQKNIFEPFYRANNTSNIAGHGLGLAIVKRIADINKVKINIISGPDQGTSFVLIFSRKF